jgi:predicted metal-dependent peptidase
MSDIISQAIVELFDTERFYAELIAQMKRTTTNRIPTAGVRIKDKIELFINPEFFESLTPKKRVAILKHECEHIMRDHIGRAKEISPEIFEKDKDVESNILNSMKHKAVNISMDCAINGTMKNLPQEGVFPSIFGLPNGETTEWYLDKLKDNDKMKNLMKFDGHDIWAESDGDKEIIKEKIRQAMNKAANKTRAAGMMTGEQELLVAAMNQSSKINWRQQLRRFIANSMEVKIESSRKKRNRRYGIKIPGYVKTEELHIGVAIDTSGSVSSEALSQFMKEIEQIAKHAKVTVVEADSEVKNSYIFKPKKEYSISGRGGTAYQPAFDFFNKEKDIDAAVYFGDMDSADQPSKPKYPVLWAIVGSQQPPANFGTQIRIEK